MKVKFFLIVLLLLSGLIASAGWVAAAAQPNASGRLESECRMELRQMIRKNLPGLEDLDVSSNPQMQHWLAGFSAAAEIEGIELGSWSRKNGSLPVQIKVRDAQGRLSRRWFKITVDGRCRVLLAVRDLRRGEPVRASDFVVRPVDCRKLRGESVSDLPADGLFQLSCNLKAGQPLPARRLRPYRLIRRGELVRVRLEQNGIRITTRGVAMNNGTLQEIITVRNPTSRKFYQARVVGDGEVVVVY